MVMLERQSVNCIMLIDDDAITNYIHERLLRRLDIAKKIKIASNGEEGLEYVEENCPHKEECCPNIIFLDLNMPVMDGFEFLSQFQKNLNEDFKNKNIKIAILTSSNNSGDMKKIRDLGDFSFLVKPLTKEKLESVLLTAD